MFLVPKILGFDVLLTNLMIVKISGGHLGRHLELQLFAPYVKVATSFFKATLGPLQGSRVKIRGHILHTGTP